MRLLTYIIAAAILWAVATTGPATSTPLPERPTTASRDLPAHARAGAAPSAHAR